MDPRPISTCPGCTVERRRTATRVSRHPASPPIVELEVCSYSAVPDYPLASVRVEIVDPSGAGIRCLFGLPQALDLALRLATSVSRLRGAPGTTP
jgi:hypothetical protein